MQLISEREHKRKYRQENESREQCYTRIADALKDGTEHFHSFRDILMNLRFLPAGRVQNAMGATRRTTPYNCFVAPTIEDSMDGIMDVAKYAAQTMRKGGGIGYDFSTLRPSGALIRSMGSKSSGPIDFMKVFDSVCKTVQSAGERRGAQMGVLRVDHPDIMSFIRAKQDGHTLTAFNISVGITDDFMEALKADADFDLVFDGQIYQTVRAQDLWNEIMRSTWDWAEPGVLFIDTINKMNNLWYCENIAATNPCGEQPLPPNGACLLGSFNLMAYVVRNPENNRYEFDMHQFKKDIPSVVRAMDNIVDRATYPLLIQKSEAISKRRMGLGVTGVANAIETLGYPYGSVEFNNILDTILGVLKNETYRASSELAKEKGSFPLYEEDLYLDGYFIKTLDDDVQRSIKENGIRNSHLTSIAPTGTISLTADNISSGIEPVFSVAADRIIITNNTPEQHRLYDHAYLRYGTQPKTADECSVDDHLGVLLIASKHVDSAVSKTCNVGDDVDYETFKEIYMRAYEGGAKGCTTFRAAGKRMGILKAVENKDEDTGEAACYIDPETGRRDCE